MFPCGSGTKHHPIITEQLLHSQPEGQRPPTHSFVVYSKERHINGLDPAPCLCSMAAMHQGKSWLTWTTKQKEVAVSIVTTHSRASLRLEHGLGYSQANTLRTWCKAPCISLPLAKWEKQKTIIDDEQHLYCSCIHDELCCPSIHFMFRLLRCLRAVDSTFGH